MLQVNGNMGGVLFDQSAKVKDREAVIQDLDKVIGMSQQSWRYAAAVPACGSMLVTAVPSISS
jgi:hypothetical protein